MAIESGLRSGSQNTVEPQVGQKRKFTANPLSELRLKVWKTPFVLTSVREKNAATPQVLPVRF